MGKSSDHELGKIIDAYLEKVRQGNPPKVEEFAGDFPKYSEQLLDVLPALAMMESLGDSSELEAVSETVSDPAPSIDPDFGDYEIVKELGRGGMGVVYEARQKSLNRRVALKLLSNRGALDPSFRDRFLLEARAAAALEHPNIVPVFDVGELNGEYFYTMRLIEGHGLDQVIEQTKRDRQKSTESATTSGRSVVAQSLTNVELESTLFVPNFERAQEKVSKAEKNQESNPKVDHQNTSSHATSIDSGSESAWNRSSTKGSINSQYFRSVAKIGALIADALSHSHKNGILHRDIKPSNLILDTSGNVWVTDFGLAKYDQTNMTRTGDIVGTLRYMAPERFSGWSDVGSDIYSLGMTLYELAVLRPAFSVRERSQLLKQILEDPVPSLRSHDASVPVALETIILKCLEKEPSNRYRNAEALRDDLNRFVNNRPIVARRNTLSERFQLWCRRNPRIATLSAMVVALTLLIIAGLSVATIQLNQSLKRTQEAERGQRESRRLANQKLIDSYFSESTARRLTTSEGRNFESWKTIEAASELMRTTDVSVSQQQLRDIAIATLPLVDVAAELDSPVSTDDEAVDLLVSEANHEGDQYALITRSGKLQIRDVVTHQVVQEISDGWHLGYQNFPMRIRFSPDDRYLAVRAPADKESVCVRVWRVSDSKCVASISVCSNPLASALQFTRNSQELGFVGEDELGLSFLTLQTGEIDRSLTVETIVQRIDFCPFGDHVVLMSDKSTDIYSRLERRKIGSLRHQSRVASLSWSSDGRFIACGSEDANVYVWDITNELKPWSVCYGHNNEVDHVRFSPTGRFLMSTALDLTTRIWDPFSGKELLRTNYGGRCFSRSGQAVLFQNRAGRFTRRRFSGDQICKVLFGNSAISNFTHLKFDPAGELLLAKSRDGSWRCWECDSGKQRVTSSIFTAGRSAQFGIEDQRRSFEGLLALPKEDDQVGKEKEDENKKQSVDENVFQIDEAHMPLNGTLEEIDFRVIGHPSNCVDGKFRSFDSTLDVRDPEPEIPASLKSEFPGATYGVAGQLIAISRIGQHVVIWDQERKKVVKALTQTSRQAIPEFSPDGSLLALCQSGFVEVYQVSDWRLVDRFESDEGAFCRVTFSQDNETLAIACLREVRIIDRSSSECVAKLPALRDSQLATSYPAGSAGIEFDASGRYLAVGTLQNTVQLWDLELLERRLSEIGVIWRVAR